MTNTPAIKIAPSILAADFARLGEAAAAAADGGADYIHVDVMDGAFVPPITLGAQMVAAIKPHAKGVPLDVHMMVHEPARLMSDFADAGADIIVVHAEACADLAGTVTAIKARGVKVGVALRPDSPLELINPVLEELDLALLMTVHPGYGGQAYIASVEQKIADLRRALDERSLRVELEVDGGISELTAARAVQAGARVLVAGSAVYGRPEPVGARIATLRRVAESGLE